MFITFNIILNILKNIKVSNILQEQMRAYKYPTDWGATAPVEGTNLRIVSTTPLY